MFDAAGEVIKPAFSAGIGRIKSEVQGSAGQVASRIKSGQEPEEIARTLAAPEASPPRT